MATMKRCRDFGTSFEQQFKALKPLEVNPFVKMMEAARLVQPNNSTSGAGAACHQATIALPSESQCGGMPSHSQTDPCTCCSHCGCGLTELQVQQCYACKNMYCSSCSVPNYDAREDRVFCLDCHEHNVVTCSDCDHSDLGDQYYAVQNDGITIDRSPSSARDFCRPGSTSRASLMKACSRAAAAASAAALTTTPFGCSGHQQHGLAAGSGFCYSDTPRQQSPVWSESAMGGSSVPTTWNGGSWKGFGAVLAGDQAGSCAFGFGRENLFCRLQGSSQSGGIGGSRIGQLIAASPVIPFMGNESYCMGTRTVEAVVTGC